MGGPSVSSARDEKGRRSPGGTRNSDPTKRKLEDSIHLPQRIGNLVE